MASKSTHEQQKTTQQSFEALAIREDARYDPGLVQFKKAMQRAERILRSNSQSIEAVGIIEELNAKWPFHSQEVVVSGRIYLNDEDENLDGYLPESWGQKKIDDWGTFYEVDEVRLVSMGVAEVSSHGKASEPSVVSFVYGFDVDDDEPSCIVRPNDAYTAEYPYPTYEACVAHLKYEHPELLAEIDRLVRPSTYDFNRLNEVLQHLIASYPDICSDTALGGWVSVYINRRVKFDQDSPYGFVVKGEMSVPDDDGADEVYVLEEPFAFDATINSIAFAEVYREGSEDEFDGSVCYLVTLPSGIKSKLEYRESQAIIPVTSIVSLEPRRPAVSVLEQLRTARLEKVRPMLAQLGMVRLADLPFEDVESLEGYEYAESEPEELTSEKQRRLLEVAFETVVDRLQQARASTFRSYEAAQTVANSLEAEMGGLLHQHDSLYQTLLSVYGEGVNLPMVRAGRKTDDDSQLVIYSVDGEMHVPSRAQEVQGLFRFLHATVEEIDDEAFLPLIYMGVSYGHEAETMTMASFDSIPVVATSVHQTVMVRMDGTAKLEIVGLERVRRKKAAIQELSHVVGARQEKKVIGRLSQAFSSELPNAMISLKNMQVVSDLESILLATTHPYEVSNALKAIIGDGRPLMLSGELVDASGETLSANDLLVTCLDVVTVVPHQADNTPALVVQSAQAMLTPGAVQNEPSLMYMPIRNITALKY